MINKIMMVLLLVPAVMLGADFPEPSYSLVYKTTPQAELKIHVYDRWSPERGFVRYGDKRTGVVFFNGGGWRRGWWPQFSRQAEHLARVGCVCICVEYRVELTHGTTVYDCVEDARDAIKFVRFEAEDLGIDPQKIVAAGGSAGGHLALMCCFDPGSRPDGLIIFNGVLNTGPEGFGSNIIGDGWRTLSPYHLIEPGMPRAIMFHGIADPTVPLQNALDFRDRYFEKGNVCQLYQYPWRTHGFFNYYREGYVDGANPDYYRTLFEALVFLGWYDK